MKTDLYRLQRIADTGRQLQEVIAQRNITKEDLLACTDIQWMLTTPLYNIGEQANCLSKDTTDAHPEIPWASIAGLRHRLVHDYEGTNWSLIGAVVFDELPELLVKIEALLETLDE